MHEVFVRKHQEKIYLGSLNCIWEHNVTVSETVCKNVSGFSCFVIKSIRCGLLLMMNLQVA
jgi:hypothetical protein